MIKHGIDQTLATLDSCSTFVSGVLTGMSDALQQGGAAPASSRGK